LIWLDDEGTTAQNDEQDGVQKRMIMGRLRPID
jgi:hypothetical protein